MKSIIGILLSLACLTWADQQTTTDRGYLFTAPKRLFAGDTQNACLTIYNLKAPAEIFVQLLTPIPYEEDKRAQYVEQVLSTSNAVLEDGGDSKCLELYVPATRHTNARLRLLINFANYPDYKVNVTREVYIERESLITFVETDKPVYKPGQNVNIRVLALDHNLMPYKEPIPSVWIENPSDVRLAQWTNVTTDNGMAQLLFPLSAEPTPGLWTIKMESRKNEEQQVIHRSTFKVKKYVLPRFQLTAHAPDYIQADEETVKWKFCARYTYGKGVKGDLALTLTPEGNYWTKRKYLNSITHKAKVNSADGCSEFELPSASLNLTKYKASLSAVFVSANFTEDGTGKVEAVINRRYITHDPIKLEFWPHSSYNFKAGLPYYGKLKVAKTDDKPVSDEMIQICLKIQGLDEWDRKLDRCTNFTSSKDGYVEFVVPPQPQNITMMNIEALAVNRSPKYYTDKKSETLINQPKGNLIVSPMSTTENYITFEKTAKPIVCDEDYMFNVLYTIPDNRSVDEPIVFHYAMHSKGDLSKTQRITEKPKRDEAFNAQGQIKNVLGRTYDVDNKEYQFDTIYKLPLTVRISQKMAPVAELMVYYMNPNREMVAATHTIEIGNCLDNKVNMTWQDAKQLPGSPTKLQIEAAPWSLCGVSAVDKATMFLDGSESNLVDAAKAFEHLKRFHGSQKYPSNERLWPHCKKEVDEDDDARRKKRSYMRRGRGNGNDNYNDAMQAFDDFGVLVFTDLTIESRQCPQYHPWMATRTHAYGSTSNFLAFQSGISGGGFAAGAGALHSVAQEASADRIHFKGGAPAPAFATLSLDSSVERVQSESVVTELAPTLRTFFPETWLWELVPTGKEGKITLERKLPDTITDWVGHTVCISPKHGLGVAKHSTITAFQPFFLDYTLPYSVKRGEQLVLKVSLFNYLDANLPVTITLDDITGFELKSEEKKLSICVKPQDNYVHEFKLLPKVLGDVNITVTAATDPEAKDCDTKGKLVVARDTIVKPMLVIPEGFPAEQTMSSFLCPTKSSKAIAWNMELPKNLVADSARAFLTVSGDIMGAALDNLDNLVKLPVGCGEQNMLLFVPNIHAINYLDANNRTNQELKAKALRNMMKGYQRELNYRHYDGSYSAFGPDNHDSEGSLWLTAFVVKSFAQAKNMIDIDEKDLKLSVDWIIKKQQDNGCFPVVGKVFHKEMKGGLQEDGNNVALTAYVLTALLESGIPIKPEVIKKSSNCLEKGLTTKGSTSYTNILSTYALTLLNHPNAQSSMKKFADSGNRQKNQLWWEDKERPSLGSSIEMTAYAVLTLIKLGGEQNMAEAFKAVQWMTKQRNAQGGFTSTQDTVIGLEALAKYASALSTEPTQLSVLMSTGTEDQVYKMSEQDKLVLKQFPLPKVPVNVEVYAEGQGCAMVQCTMRYNTLKPSGTKAFELTATSNVEYYYHTAQRCGRQRINVCASYKLPDEESNMVLLEIDMISGFVADKSSLNALLQNNATRVKRFEEGKGKVVIYFDSLTAQKTCIDFAAERETVVENPKAANIKIYDYYQQELSVSAKYQLTHHCRFNEDGSKPTVENKATAGNGNDVPQTMDEKNDVEVFSTDAQNNVITEVDDKGLPEKMQKKLEAKLAAKA